MAKRPVTPGDQSTAFGESPAFDVSLMDTTNDDAAFLDTLHKRYVPPEFDLIGSTVLLKRRFDREREAAREYESKTRTDQAI